MKNHNFLDFTGKVVLFFLPQHIAFAFLVALFYGSAQGEMYALIALILHIVVFLVAIAADKIFKEEEFEYVYDTEIRAPRRVQKKKSHD